MAAHARAILQMHQGCGQINCVNLSEVSSGRLLTLRHLSWKC